MSQTTWKAGDTCTIKPSRGHGIGKAKCASLWTIDSLDESEACVHNGAPGHLDIRTAPGLTCAARVPLSCLLPAGDARPTVAAEMGAEVLQLRARVAELEATNAELMATLANERGEGEAPCEGWAWGQGGEIPDPCWHKGDAVAYMEKAFAPEPATPAHYWLWWVPGMPCCQRADTARAAIRAASSQGADVPKEG